MDTNFSYNGTKKKTDLVQPVPSTTENLDENKSHHRLDKFKRNSDEEIENEIQNFDLESTLNEKLPLFQLFPDLEEEYPDEKEFLNRSMSTTDVARLLQGKKANFAFLKSCQKLSIEPRLSAVLEKSENDSTTSENKDKNETSNNY